MDGILQSDIYSQSHRKKMSRDMPEKCELMCWLSVMLWYTYQQILLQMYMWVYISKCKITFLWLVGEWNISNFQITSNLLFLLQNKYNKTS